MNYSKLITHSGYPHSDDLLAVCIALYMFPSIREVNRLPKVTREMLDDPNILVLDIGEEYTPEKGNFDHHQDGEDVEGKSAVRLLMNYIVSGGLVDGITMENIDKWFYWLSPVDLWDCYGLKGFSGVYDIGADGRRFAFKHPFIDSFKNILKLETSIPQNSTMFAMLKLVGKDLVEEASNSAMMYNQLKLVIKQYNYGDYSIVRNISDVAIKPALMDMYIANNGFNADLVITTSERDSKHYNLFRPDGSKLARLNVLKEVEGLPEFEFIAKKGFLAVIPKTISEEDILHILSELANHSK